MNIERSFRLSSLLLAASAFTGLTLAAEVPAPLVLLAVLALAVMVIYEFGWGLVGLATQLTTISPGVWNVLMVLAFLASTADALWGSQDVLLAGINFLVVLMVNKIFNLHERKDFLYLYAISLLQLLATAALTVEPWYALVFVAYLLSAIWTLLLYHLRNEADEITGAAGPQPPRAAVIISGRFFWTTNAIAVSALVMTLAIFFVTPRAGAGFFQKSRGQAIRTSGFSETVDLGVMGTVKRDPTVVMRVEFPDLKGPTLQRMYLQGAAYDFYTGRTWVNSLSRRHAVQQALAGTFVISRRGTSRLAERGIRQDILMEALDTPVLFGMPVVKRIKGTFLLLHADRIGGIHLPYPPNRRFQYSVLSLPNLLAPEEERTARFDYPPLIKKRYLQLPRQSPRIAELAQDVTKNETSPYRKAVAIKWHLVRGYKYSLDVGEEVPGNPVEEFLFNRKTGYCEHYATAMVLMLRSLDIPARLVTGFLAGEWNDFGNYYTVRQQDAHAWVEVYFPKSGWIIFDPTPSAASPPQVSTTAMLTRLIDSFRLKWTRLVIQYSFRDQQAVLEEIRDRSQPARSRATEWVTASLKWMKNWRAWMARHVAAWDWRHLVAWMVGIIALTMLVRMWRVRRRWSPRNFAPQCTLEQRAATKLYGRMLQLLESQGISRPPNFAPLEFAGFVGGRWAEADGLVRSLTDLYCRGRFGTRPLEPEDLQHANGLLANLRSMIRTGHSPNSRGQAETGSARVLASLRSWWRGA